MPIRNLLGVFCLTPRDVGPTHSPKGSKYPYSTYTDPKVRIQLQGSLLQNYQSQYYNCFLYHLTVLGLTVTPPFSSQSGRPRVTDPFEAKVCTVSVHGGFSRKELQSEAPSV